MSARERKAPQGVGRMLRLQRAGLALTAASALIFAVSCSAISQYMGLGSNSIRKSNLTSANGVLTVALSTSVSGTASTIPIPFSALFSQEVSGFSLADITVVNGTATNLVKTGSCQYAFGIVPSGNSTVSVAVPAGIVYGADGSLNAASNQLSVPFYSALPVVSFSNVATNDVLDTSLIKGNASSPNPLSTVQVSLDGGAYAPATGTSSWSFRLPTGSGTWEYHSVHTISVEAVDNAGNTSSPVTITVKQGNNLDINGDGYPDLVVGASGYNSGQGRIYVYYGSSSGLSGTLASSAASLTIDGTVTNFGSNIAVGDFNGDGYADVAVGNPSAASNAGEVEIFYGSSAGLSSTPGTTITGQSASYLGWSLAVGDINGDGYGDLGVTAEGTSHDYIFYGSSTGIPGVNLATGSAPTDLWTSDGIPMGNNIAFGDVNGDGKLDVAVSGYNVNGQAYLVLGTGAILPSEDLATNSAGLSVTPISQGGVSQAFGQSPIAFGDFNGDGYDDLVITAYYYASTAGDTNGRAYIFYGSSTGLAVGSSASAGTANAIITGPSNSNLGARLSVGRVNGDAYDDLIVGGLDESIGSGNSGYYQGHAYVFEGGAGGIPTTDLSAGGAANLTFSGKLSSKFGVGPTSMFDFNGDGYEDFIFGAPSASGNAGEVDIFDGSPTGLTSVDLSQDPSAATATITGPASSSFGSSMN